MIEEAASPDRPTDLGGKTVVLRRGQLSHSIRFLAGAWKWHRSAVQRFIERLKTDTMIEVSSDTGCLTITICNYDAYQAAGGGADTQSNTSSDTLPIRGQYTADTNDKEGKEGKERKKITDSTSPMSAEPTAPADPSDQEATPDELFPGAQVVRMPPDQTEQAVAAWNALAAGCGLSRVKTLTAARRAALRARLRECGGIAGWEEALGQVRGSDFLLGQNDRGWKADFDFVLQAKSFAKLREGAYGNRGKIPTGKPAGGKLSWLAAEVGLNRSPEPAYDLDLRAECAR